MLKSKLSKTKTTIHEEVSSWHLPDLILKLYFRTAIIRIRPQGYSMYPLFIPGRDEALIESVSADTVRKNDVVLYRRDQSILVLHRICKITAEGFFMVGDNQSEIEGPLRADQIKGRLIAFVHNGKEISVKNPLYRFLSALWLFMLPLRPVCFRITAFLRGSK